MCATMSTKRRNKLKSIQKYTLAKVVSICTAGALRENLISVHPVIRNHHHALNISKYIANLEGTMTDLMLSTSLSSRGFSDTGTN